VRAQGTFAFNNFSPTVDAPIRDLANNPIVDSTGRYMATAAYIVGASQATGNATNPSASLQAIAGLSASFIGFNGYFAPSQPAIAGQPAGTVLTLVIRAWDTQTGATWATAGVRGQSGGFNYTLVSPSTPGPDPAGLTGFQLVNVVPEPSTFALAGLGCQPQIGSFGYSEQQAKDKGYDVKTATFPFSANGKAQGLGDAVGFVKVVADAEHNEILGAHMIGPEVTEMLPVLTLAQQWDLTADEVARNVFAHPTLSEAVKEAVHGIAGHMINF